MRILLAALAGAVVVFVVSALAHMASPLGTAGIREVPNEAAFADALKANLSQPGLYLGNSGLFVYSPMGEMSPAQLGLEFLSVFLAAWILARLVGTYLLRASAVAVLAVFAFLSVTASHWIWYHFPTDFVLAALVTELIAWLCAGLVMAKIVRPPVRLA